MQPSETGQRLSNIQRLVPKLQLLDAQRLLVHRLSISQPVLLLVQPSEIVQHLCNAHRVFAFNSFNNVSALRQNGAGGVIAAVRLQLSIDFVHTNLQKSPCPRTSWSRIMWGQSRWSPTVQHVQHSDTCACSFVIATASDVETGAAVRCNQHLSNGRRRTRTCGFQDHLHRAAMHLLRNLHVCSRQHIRNGNTRSDVGCGTGLVCSCMHGDEAALGVEGLDLAHSSARRAVQAAHQHTAPNARRMRVRCHMPLQPQVRRPHPQRFLLAARSHTYFNTPVALRRVRFSLHNRSAAIQIRLMFQLLQNHALADTEHVLPGRRRGAVESASRAAERFGHGSERFCASLFRLEGFYCSTQLPHQIWNK